MRNEVEGPARAAKELSAFSAAHRLTVERALNRRNTGGDSNADFTHHRTLACIFRLAHRRKRGPTDPHRADLHKPPAMGALRHKHSVRRDNSRCATASPASTFRRAMRRDSATDNGGGDEPDAGPGMHHGMERAKGIEPSYAAWEAAVLPLNYARGSLPMISRPRAIRQAVPLRSHDVLNFR